MVELYGHEIAYDGALLSYYEPSSPRKDVLLMDRVQIHPHLMAQAARTVPQAELLGQIEDVNTRAKENLQWGDLEVLTMGDKIIKKSIERTVTFTDAVIATLKSE